MLGIKKEVEIPSEIDESNYVLIGNENQKFLIVFKIKMNK